MQDEVNRKWNLLTPVLDMIEMSCHEWIMMKHPGKMTWRPGDQS